MSIKIFCRCGVALALAALVSGCSLLGSSDDAVSDSGRVNECSWNRSKCMYEGKYEPDERDYAEEEAKRLNKAASDRLRRNSGW